jgi:hypothetical protein
MLAILFMLTGTNTATYPLLQTAEFGNKILEDAISPFNVSCIGKFNDRTLEWW